MYWTESFDIAYLANNCLPKRYKNNEEKLETMRIFTVRALRSRSLRDGSLSHKGRFAAFVRSCSAVRASNNSSFTTLYLRHK